jgi:hypothetical protein
MNRIPLFLKYALSAVIGLCVMTGCVDEYEAELPEGDSHLLVVSGTICSGRYSEFHLTWSVPLRQEADYNYYSSLYSSSSAYSEVQPVRDARVAICGTDGSVYECPEHTVSYDNHGYSYSFGTGVYGCDTPELNPDVSYYVTIDYDGDTYRSTPEKPIRTPDIESLEYFQKDSQSSVEVLLTTAEPDNPDQTTYCTWTYGETWEVRPLRQTVIYFDVSTMTRQYLTGDQQYPARGWKFGHEESIISASTANYADGRFNRYQLLDIPRDDERVSWCYSNEVTQRAVSKTEYEYMKACLEAGWEMGGLFSPQPSALPTNIHCLTSSKRAIGYVGCSQNVATKRMYINASEISRDLPKPGPFVEFDCSERDCAVMVQQGWILYLWYDNRIGGGPLTTYWAYPADFDVRLHGAVTYKPDYMP